MLLRAFQVSASEIISFSYKAVGAQIYLALTSIFLLIEESLSYEYPVDMYNFTH